MKNLFQILYETLLAKEDVVLITIVASSGSVPRGSGARMLVTKNGRIAGTIGGGAVEHKSIEIAKKALIKKSSFSENFRLYPNDVADLGMVCGGDVEVSFCYLSSEQEKVVALTEKILQLYDEKKPTWLITKVSAQEGCLSVFTGSRIYGEDLPEEVKDAIAKKPVLMEYDGKRYYVEKIVDAGYVYIFGGGHVAQQLVPVLYRCGFDCIVVEDRADFADPALFENKAKTICLPMEELDTLLPDITEDDYICVMTRGHQNDYMVQREMLKSPAGYIGVIGSRKKIASVRERLMAEGYTDSDIARITAPIGLEIGSETPAEIAVSIVAQLIMKRAGKERSPGG